MTLVRPAVAADREQTVGLLTDAFARDPVVRWFFPDDETYPARAAAFFGFLFDVRLPVDGIWVTDGGEAAALWSPPVTGSREWEDRSWEHAAADLEPEEIKRCDLWDEAVASQHPETPHWYLGVLGTASGHQGRGFGRAAAEPGLDAAAHAGLPAFVETGVERNVARYERMGFVVTGIIDDPGLPRGWCLRRDAPR